MDTSNITTTELLAILDVTRRLTEQRMVQPLIEYVGSTVFELVAAEFCQIVLFGDGEALQAPFARTRDGKPIADAQDQISRSILQRVRNSLTPLLVTDAQNNDTLRTARSVRTLGLRSVMCVPLVSYGQAVGAIYVENRSARSRFREESLIPLVLFSNQVVVALENARLYESLEARVTERTQALQHANVQLAQQAHALREQSIRDSLTGLFNRHYFNEVLPQLFEGSRRYSHPLMIACADIDNFKRINDTLFHATGDRVLAEVGHLLSTHVRAADTIARIGGEEFAILLPETSPAAAIQTCERLRQIVSQHDWSAIAPDLAVTISIGVADSTHCGSVEDLLHCADTRLYTAKRLGKNRVVAVE